MIDHYKIISELSYKEHEFKWLEYFKIIVYRHEDLYYYKYHLNIFFDYYDINYIVFNFDTIEKLIYFIKTTTLPEDPKYVTNKSNNDKLYVSYYYRDLLYSDHLLVKYKDSTNLFSDDILMFHLIKNSNRIEDVYISSVNIHYFNKITIEMLLEKFKDEAFVKFSFYKKNELFERNNRFLFGNNISFIHSNASIVLYKYFNGDYKKNYSKLLEYSKHPNEITIFCLFFSLNHYYEDISLFNTIVEYHGNDFKNIFDDFINKYCISPLAISIPTILNLKKLGLINEKLKDDILCLLKIENKIIIRNIIENDKIEYNDIITRTNQTKLLEFARIL